MSFLASISKTTAQTSQALARVSEKLAPPPVASPEAPRESYAALVARMSPAERRAREERFIELSMILKRSHEFEDEEASGTPQYMGEPLDGDADEDAAFE